MFAGRPMKTIKAVFPQGLGGEVRKEHVAFCIIPVSWAHEEGGKISAENLDVFLKYFQVTSREYNKLICSQIQRTHLHAEYGGVQSVFHFRGFH